MKSALEPDSRRQSRRPERGGAKTSVNGIRQAKCLDFPRPRGFGLRYFQRAYRRRRCLFFLRFPRNFALIPRVKLALLRRKN